MIYVEVAGLMSEGRGRAGGNDWHDTDDVGEAIGQALEKFDRMWAAMGNGAAVTYTVTVATDASPRRTTRGQPLPVPTERYPTYDDLVEALGSAGATLDAFEPCPIQGVLIRWHREPRDGEALLGMPVQGPVAGEVIERHYTPDVEAVPGVARVTEGRAIQQVLWALAQDRV